MGILAFWNEGICYEMAHSQKKVATMKECDRLTKALIDGAKRGEDLWVLLDAEREHLARCPACHEKFVQLARAVLSNTEEIPCAECRVHWPNLIEIELRHKALTEELQLAKHHMTWCHTCAEEYAQFLELMRLEELGQLEEPKHYPDFDLSFLSPDPPPEVWRTTALQSPEDASQRVRQLAKGIELRIKVYKYKMNASFEGLTGWLSSSVMWARAPVVEPVRRGGKKKRVGKGQVLSLPDPEGNLEITLAVQNAGKGRSHLSIELREVRSGRPVEWAKVNLRYAGGEEETRTRARGKATFQELEPGEYTIEIKPTKGEKAEQLWRFTITLEST